MDQIQFSPACRLVPCVADVPLYLGVCVVGIYAPEGCQHGKHTNVRCCLVFSVRCLAAC